MNIFSPTTPWHWFYYLHVDRWCCWNSSQRAEKWQNWNRSPLLYNSKIHACFTMPPCFSPKTLRVLVRDTLRKRKIPSLSNLWFPVLKKLKHIVSDHTHVSDFFQMFPSNELLGFFFTFTIILVHTRFSTASNMVLLVALSFYPQKTWRTSGKCIETSQHASLYLGNFRYSPWYTLHDSLQLMKITQSMPFHKLLCSKSVFSLLKL